MSLGINSSHQIKYCVCLLLVYKIIWTEGNRLSAKKHGKRSSRQAIRLHLTNVVHPPRARARPRHHVLITGKRRNAFPIKTARKYSTYRRRFAALGKLVQISRKCLRRKRFAALVNEFVPLLSHIFSLKHHEILPPVRASPPAPLKNRFTEIRLACLTQLYQTVQN